MRGNRALDLLVFLGAAFALFALAVPYLFEEEAAIGPTQARLIVVLDIGHGGSDPGSVVSWANRPENVSRRPLYEHTLAYDVASRMIDLLRGDPSIDVLPTVLDESSGYLIDDRPNPDLRPTEILRTTPPYDLNAPYRPISVNLRWMLSNSWVQRIHGQGLLDGRSVIFLSLHVDARTTAGPSGLEIYVPQNRERHTGQLKRSVYGSYAEAREALADSLQIDLGSQGFEESMALADAIVDGFRQRGLEVGDRPIRTVIRTDAEAVGFVPAVLEYNQVPCRALIELANLNDPADQDRMASPRYRQQAAEAIVSALRACDCLIEAVPELPS